MTEHAYKAGDILVSHWGATMVMVSWYRIERATSHTVWMRPIASIETPDGFLTGTSTPCLPTIPTGEMIMRKIKANGRVRGFYSSERYVVPWDGQPKRFDHCD